MGVWRAAATAAAAAAAKKGGGRRNQKQQQQEDEENRICLEIINTFNELKEETKKNHYLYHCTRG